MVLILMLRAWFEKVVLDLFEAMSNSKTLRDVRSESMIEAHQSEKKHIATLERVEELIVEMNERLIRIENILKMRSAVTIPSAPAPKYSDISLYPTI